MNKMLLRKNLLAIFVLTFTLTNCSSNNDHDQKELKNINISVNAFKSSGNISDFLEVTELIPLETTDNSLVNNIDRIKKFREQIYIFDQRSRKLLRFKSDGSFLGQIGRIGKGPGEYTSIIEFELDTLREQVYLLDVWKIHTFSLAGEFIKTTNTKFFGSELHIASSDEFIFTGAGRDDRIIITDANFNVKNKFFPYSTAYRIDPNFTFSNFEDNTAFHLATCDTIYTFIGEQPSPLFYIDLNGKNFTNDDFNDLSQGQKENLFDYTMNGNKYVRCLAFLPINNYVFMILSYSKAAYWGIYNLENDEYKFINMSKVNNDIFGSFQYFHPKGIINQELVFPIPPHKLIKDKSSDFYKNNIEKLSKINEYSNPVLLLAKVKM